MPSQNELTSWRYFVQYAKSGTLSEAAMVLDVEPSTISRAISKLEKSLGTALVTHATKPQQLTENGRIALKKIEPILRAYDSMIDGFIEGNRSLEGVIKLSSAQGFASRRLTPLLAEWNTLYPATTVEILAGLKEIDVVQGKCDIATLTGEPKLQNLVYMSRGRNVYLPVASPEYVSRFGMPLSPDDLKKHVGFAYAGPVRSETTSLFRGGVESRFEFQKKIHSTDILAIRNSIKSGLGVAVDLPLIQIAEDLLNGSLVPILNGWHRPPIECFIVTSKSDWHKKRIRIFLEWYATKMQDLFFSIEKSVSSVVGLPEDCAVIDRKAIYKT